MPVPPISSMTSMLQDVDQARTGLPGAEAHRPGRQDRTTNDSKDGWFSGQPGLRGRRSGRLRPAGDPGRREHGGTVALLIDEYMGCPRDADGHHGASSPGIVSLRIDSTRPLAAASTCAYFEMFKNEDTLPWSTSAAGEASW